MSYKNIKKIIIIIIVLLVSVIIGLLAYMFRSRNNENQSNKENYTINNQIEINSYTDNNVKSYEQPLIYMCTGIQNNDYKTYLKAYPKAIQLELEKDSEDETHWDNQCKTLETRYGNNYSYTYKIKERKALTSSEIVALEDYYDSGNIDIIVSEGYELSVDLTISGSKNTETKNSTLYIFRSSGNWYLDFGSGAFKDYGNIY